ncbi:MAG TPA: hypothetical protein VMW37_03190 [Dehalococcoidales bacterium]|nr:hypothetical protein [Dehalococcoidales bacterium]
MARVQRKTSVTIEAEVIGYDERKKGHLTFTSGNIYYYRPNAKKITVKYTYQQLIDLFESELSAQ